MLIDTINFPDELIDELNQSNLVVFAGAGVSMGPPANLPSFYGLCKQVAKGTGELPSSTQPLDRFLGLLAHNGVSIHKRVADALTPPASEHKQLHRDLLRLFPSVEKVRLVTTNFDTLFEDASTSVFNKSCAVFSAPALPLGSEFSGIVHVHGVVDNPASMVLTDRDFGKAYLTQGWARRFLVDLFMTYTVLFVGYSHNDVVIEYLTRALPRQGKKNQFILVPSDKSKSWDVKGIIPVEYLQESARDYSKLEGGINYLAELLNRKAVDWNEEIRRISSSGPPKDLKDKDTIIHSLKEEYTTRFFTDHADAAGWVEWLDESGVIDDLFKDNDLSNINLLLSDWIASKFAIRHHEEVMSAMSRHGMNINPALWRSIARRISLDDKQIIPVDSFNRWVTILCDHKPNYIDTHSFVFMAKQACEISQIDLIPIIFDSMTKPKLHVKQSLNIYYDPESDNLKAEMAEQSDTYCAKEVLEKNILPHINKLYTKVFANSYSQIRLRFEKVNLFRCMADQIDLSSWRRHAIEKHEQDQHEDIEDIIINATRDSLEYAISNKPVVAESWINCLINEESSLLKRIGIHGLRLVGTTSCDYKLDSIVDNHLLFNIDLRHEIFILIRECYSLASDETRQRLIDSVFKFRLPQDKYNHQESTDREHYTWLGWINDSMPTCPFASSAFNKIQKKHPEWKTREHPDITSWHEIGFVEPKSPWTIQELQDMDIENNIRDLLHFKGDKYNGPDRNGLLQAITKSSEDDYTWGFNLAKSLATREDWDSDIWPRLIKSWHSIAPSHSAWASAMEWITDDRIQKNHEIYVSELLYENAKDTEKDIPSEALETLNSIATKHLSLLLYKKEKDGEDTKRWLQSAINHPAGILAEFWIHSLSIWRKHNSSASNIPKMYRDKLESMIRSESHSGGYFRSVICSQLNFLLYLDESWTAENIIPLFTDKTKPSIMNQSWDGYLTWGRPTELSFKYLKCAYKDYNKVDFLDEEEHRQRFIDFYTICLLHFVESGHEEWVQILFSSDNQKDVLNFGYRIGSYLKEANIDHKKASWNKWIKNYWKERIDGVPRTISNDEVAIFLSWPLSLPFVFDEAVEIATSMPTATIDHCSIVWRLRKSELITTNPDSVCKLLIFFSKLKNTGHCWYGISDFIQKLLENASNEEIKNELINVLMKLGLKCE